MKNIFIAILIMQILLICAGVWELTIGKIETGLFNILLNTLFGLLNFYNIKTFKNK
jgi:uncharacterized membrane protein YiaA